MASFCLNCSQVDQNKMGAEYSEWGLPCKLVENPCWAGSSPRLAALAWLTVFDWKYSAWSWCSYNGGTWVWSHSWRSPWKGPHLSSVVWRIQPYMACIEQAPDASPTHGSGKEHVCTRLVQLWENSKGAIYPKRNIHRLMCASAAYFHTATICSVGPLQRREHQMCPGPSGSWDVHGCSLGLGWRYHLWGLCGYF